MVKMGVFKNKNGVLTPLAATLNIGTGGGTIKKLTQTNPVLTSSGGKCTWNFVNTLGIDTVIAQVFNVATGEVVVVDIKVTSSNIIIVINSTTDIAANKYKAVIMG